MAHSREIAGPAGNIRGAALGAPTAAAIALGMVAALVAYTGTYRIEGDRWITSVDVAWNPEWVGTEQARSFNIQGDRLQVLTPWRVMPNWADRGMTRSIVTFELVE